jgi:hypothetical protein
VYNIGCGKQVDRWDHPDSLINWFVIHTKNNIGINAVSQSKKLEFNINFDKKVELFDCSTYFSDTVLRIFTLWHYIGNLVNICRTTANIEDAGDI